MMFDLAKLKNVVLYIFANCDAAHLGAVKLNKVLYYADMLHYADNGAPLTGATYRKRALGPMCDQLSSVLKDLERSGDIEIGESIYFGYKKREYRSKKRHDAGSLTNLQTDLLNEIVDFVCNQNSAKTISELSHNRAWEMVDFGQIITYKSAIHMFPIDVSSDTMDWAGKEVARLADKNSEIGALDYKLFSDLRNGILERVRQQ